MLLCTGRRDWEQWAMSLSGDLRSHPPLEKVLVSVLVPVIPSPTRHAESLPMSWCLTNLEPQLSQHSLGLR